MTEREWAIQRIEQSREIHLAWVAHLQSPEPCDRCPPDIGHSVGDVEHHRSVAADYDRVLAVLRAAIAPCDMAADQEEWDEAVADLWAEINAYGAGCFEESNRGPTLGLQRAVARLGALRAASEKGTA